MEIVNMNFDETQWVPVGNIDRDGNTTERLYAGQLVSDAFVVAGNIPDGVVNLGAADGVADTDDEAVVKGLVLGTNNWTRVFDSSMNNHEYIDSVVTQAALGARENIDTNKVWAQGDKRPFVHIARITPATRIKAPLYNSTYGTAPSLLTVTTGSTDGFGFTSNACDFTPVAQLCSAYCRTGANRGAIRQTNDTSTTVAAIRSTDAPFQNDIAIGDEFIRVPLRSYGMSYVQFDAQARFVDVSATPATNYYIVHVVELNLEKAGEEYVIFTFDPIHFCSVRA